MINHYIITTPKANDYLQIIYIDVETFLEIMEYYFQIGGYEMCTAVSYRTDDHYFGRNLDVEYSYHEKIIITARKFPFNFFNSINNCYAMIGIGSVIDNYPLFYDATNEHGLSMAGLYFPGNGEYLPVKPQTENVAPYNFIPWVLSQCKSTEEARKLIQRINLANIAFREDIPPTPLHWIIADRFQSIVIEPCVDGIKIFDNPIGVLTNNPPFDFHLYNLCNYMNLTREEPSNRFSEKISLNVFSRGMGAIGLPGDLSSPSRFVRVAFTKLNSVSEKSENSSISQFFHILDSVAQQRGCAKINGKYEMTVYSSCCNTNKCIYYYKTYENSQINAVHLFHEDLDTDNIIIYELNDSPQISAQN